MDRIVAARVFITIVDRGSMVEAGKALDMSRSMVTRYLAEIEDWADTRLLHRSTRRLSLTPGGEHVLEQCRQLLATAEKLANVPNGSEREPSGIVRISCAHFVAVELLSDTYVQSFQDKYPKVTLDFHISNQTVDLVEDRIDLAIRITNELDPNLISRKFGVCHSTICASPEYLGRVPQPRKPADLATLNCLTYSYFANRLWQFRHQDSHSTVAVGGNFSANESGVLLHYTLAGCGISMIPTHSAAPYLASGELIALLPEYDIPTLGIHGVYQSRSHLPHTTRIVIDSLVDHFKLPHLQKI